ncbi:MAG: triose-phosphate isomerase [Actinomycetota bacterium]|nr:triose-phosphate isomerase [Actinomycetota bacterium]
MEKIIGANLKIYFKDKKEFKEYAQTLIKEMDFIKSDSLKVYVLPDFLNIPQASEIFKNTKINIGAQDLFWEDSGPYTGAISPLLLKDFGCTLVFVGHSERRRYFNENDYILNKKVHACYRVGLIPIVLIGETEEERSYGLTDIIIEKQIRIILNNLPYDFLKNIVIMYEPVWAIGKADAATPEIIEKSFKFIRKTLLKIYDKNLSENIKVIYGGSVNPSNASEILKIKGADGLGVTRSSLNVREFVKIIRIAEKI